MGEERGEVKRWILPLKIVAVVLVVAILFSLVLPAVASSVTAAKESPAPTSSLTADAMKSYEQLADVSISGASYEDARICLEEAMALAEEMGNTAELARLSLKTASVCVLLGQNGDALKLLNKSLELDAESSDALLLRAQLYVERGDTASALPDLEAYCALCPDDSDMALALAQLREAAGEYISAAEEYERLYEKDGSDDSNYLNALRCRFLAGEYDTAVASFDSYIAASGEDAPYYPVAIFLRAACVMQLGRIDEAEAGFTQAMDSGYDEAACIEQIMLCSFEREAYSEAVAYGEKLVEMDAALNTPELFYQRMGASLMLMERYDEAVQYLNKADELNVSMAGNAYYRGVSLMALERYEEAVESFTKTIEEGYLPQFGYYNRGVCYVQLLDYDKAAQDMKMTLESGTDAELIAAAEDIISQIDAYNAGKNAAEAA